MGAKAPYSVLYPNRPHKPFPIGRLPPPPPPRSDHPRYEAEMAKYRRFLDAEDAKYGTSAPAKD